MEDGINTKFAMYDILREDTLHLGMSFEEVRTIERWLLARATDREYSEGDHRLALFGTRYAGETYVPSRHLERVTEFVEDWAKDPENPLVQTLRRSGRSVLNGAQIREIRMARLRGEVDDE